MIPETQVLDEEEQYVQALERVKAPEGDPPPEPQTEVAAESEQNPPPEAGSSVVEAEKPPEPKGFDIATLPPEAREQFERLNQQLGRERAEKQSLLGRVPRLQSELDRLQSRERNSAPPVNPAPPATPANQDSNYFDSSDWKEFERDFPKEAAIQRKAIEAAIARADRAERSSQEVVQRVEQRFGTFDTYMREQAKQAEMAALNEAHPDWQQLALPSDDNDVVAVQIPVRGQDGKEHLVDYRLSRMFGSWLGSQHYDKQRWLTSDNAAENISLMDDFKRDLHLAELHANTQSTPARQTARTPDIDPSPRTRQTNPVSRSSGPVDPEEEEYVAALQRVASSR